jgi:hypothetical protein
MTPPVKRYIVNGYEYDIDYADGSYCHVDDWPDGPLVKASDYDALAAQMAGLRADAERYRWLQGCREVAFKRDCLSTETRMASSIPLGDSLNIAVDYWLNKSKESAERLEGLRTALDAALPAPPAATTSEKS